MDNKEFLRFAYLEFFKRKPDHDGFDYYLSKLDHKKLTREDVISFFKTSEEYKRLRENPWKYLYQPIYNEISFEEGVALLSQKLKNNVHIGYINNVGSDIVNEVYEGLNKIGISTNRVKVRKEEYKTYLKKVNYKKKYPDYYKDTFEEKSLEHFLCYKLLKLKKGDNFIDIASEHSPVPMIFQRLTSCNSYAQDIMYEEGIHENKIGGDASTIPVPDNFFKAAIATCSIEHFEKDSDIKFMKEMERVLMSGGKIMIVPLYMFINPAVQTDPRCSLQGNVEFDMDADIYCAKEWGNRHGRHYSPETLHRRLIEPNKNMKFEIYLLDNPQDIHRSVYCRFFLIGTKK